MCKSNRSSSFEIYYLFYMAISCSEEPDMDGHSLMPHHNFPVCFLRGSAVADLRGAPGTRPPPPEGQNSFIFMQFSAKKIGSHTHLGSWRPPPPPGKILDPPLEWVDQNILI